MSLVGEMEDAPAFKFIERSDFARESVEGGLWKGAKVLGGEAKDLCGVVETRNRRERVVKRVVFEWVSPRTGASADVFEGDDGVRQTKGDELED
jgi:hypothetical protein